MEKIIEVYMAGSQLAINSGATGIVEKAIIGANEAIQYQLICNVPERHQIMVNDFEVSPIEGKVKKCPIGFTRVVEPEKKEVTILVDDEDRIIHVDAPDEVLVGMGVLDAEQVAEYRAIQEANDGEAEEEIKEEELEDPS